MDNIPVTDINRVNRTSASFIVNQLYDQICQAIHECV